MDNYTITETYTLPSKGLIYSRNVNPQVTLRSLTTNEEMLRLSPSTQVYKNMADIIDKCIVNDIGISAYDMCLGDYQFLLYKLRTVTYGPDYGVTTTCPLCGYVSNESINMDDLVVFEYDEKIEQLKEFKLPKSGNTIKLKFITPRMLDEINEKVKDYRKKTNTSVDMTLVYTISSSIESIDGKRPDPILIDQMVRDLPMIDTNTIIAYYEKLNTSIGVDSNVTIVCDVCGLEYKSQFKTTSEFFRPTLDIGW